MIGDIDSNLVENQQVRSLQSIRNLISLANETMESLFFNRNVIFFRFLTYSMIFMSISVSRLAKGSIAEIANVWTLSGMCSFMVLYIAKFREFLTTFKALIELVDPLRSFIFNTGYLKPFVFLYNFLLHLFLLTFQRLA